MVVPRGKFDSTNQKHYPDLGSDASSVWNFFARFSDVIWGGNQWSRLEMSAVFSRYVTDWVDKTWGNKTWIDKARKFFFTDPKLH